MGVEGVQYLEGRVECDCDRTVTTGKKEVGRWATVVEGYLICLKGLLM